MKITDIYHLLDQHNIKYLVDGKFDKSIDICGFSSLFRYKNGTLTFVAPERNFIDYQDLFIDREISLAIISMKEQVHQCFLNTIKADDPRVVFFLLADEFASANDSFEVTGITSSPKIYRQHSFIAPTAQIGNNVKIGIGCIIEGDVVIGDDTEIHHHVTIRNKTKIGKCCTIHSGVIIGEYGFGYTVDNSGVKHMLKHYGGVCIEDYVHIGDNCCIIRGALDDTIICRGVKLNTMVHIAHNDVVGENTIITAPTHVCGSVKIGRSCHIAGVAIRNQCSVGDRTTVGLGAVVINNINNDMVVAGNPAKPLLKK